MSELKGQALCDAYLAEIRRVSGDECASKSEAYYSKGWYYVKIAQKAHDGSWGVWGIATAFRAHDIIARVRTLRDRIDYKTRQNRLAKTREVELDYHISVERFWREHSDDYEIRLSIPCKLIKGLQDMRDFRDVVNRAIEIAEEMETNVD